MAEGAKTSADQPESRLPRYRVLGPVGVLDDTGTPIPLSSARQRLLVAILLADPGQVVSTDQLLEALWGDEPPADPKASLQSQIWRLRRRLGKDAPLHTTPSGYRLDVGTDLDATRFERLVAEARQGDGDADITLARCDEALSLWRGAAFADLSDHPALMPRAAALDELRADAGEARAAALLAAGRQNEAAAAAEALALENPFRERPVDLRMRALAAAGRVVEALRVYDAFRRRLGEEVGLDPSPELRALEADIVRHEQAAEAGGPVPQAAAPTSGAVVRPLTMAAPIDAFVGRQEELEQVSHLLEVARLVTLIGPGGVGKTRLCLQLVDRLTGRYPDGIWCCDLAAATSDDRVADVVATLARIDRREGATMVERVVEFLAFRRSLVLLDNCEHVIEGAAALAQAILAGDPAVEVLATSREPLGVPGEQRLPLDPLPIPDHIDAEAPAVVLFAKRAAAVNPGFSLTDDNLPAACELCRRVDGLPLAIELAAARVGARTVAEVNVDVGERLGSLSSGGRGRVARHRSTHAVVEWSYDLLPNADRRFFEQLAVFAGGWSVPAAHHVCQGKRPAQVVDQLVRLVDQSLVVARASGDATRYTLLEPIRAYAADRLRRAGRDAATRGRHAAFFTGLAEQAARGLQGKDEPAWMACLDRELANLRAAHEWFVARGDGDGALRLLAALFWCGFGGGAAEVFAWAEETVRRFGDLEHPSLPTVCALGAVGAWRRGDLIRCRSLAERGVNAGRAAPVTARLARVALGDWCTFRGEFDASVTHYLAAVELGRSVGDDFQAAWNTADAALSCAYGGDVERACRLADEAIAAAEGSGSPSLLAFAHYVAGEVRLDSAPVEAARLLERSLTEARRVPNRFILGLASLSAVSVEARTADPQSALRRYPDLIEQWRRAGAWNQQWITIRTLVETLARAGQSEPAAVLYGALCASGSATPLAGADAARLEAVVGVLRGRLGDEDLEALRARGVALGDAGAVAYALDTLRVLTGVEAT